MADGIDEGVVFVGTLGSDTEEVVGESRDIMTVTNEDAMLVDEIVFQVGTGMVFNLTKHVVRLGLKGTDAFYLTQSRAQPLRLHQIGVKVGDGGLVLLDEELTSLDGKGIHRPRLLEGAQQLKRVGVGGDIT